MIKLALARPARGKSQTLGCLNVVGAAAAFNLKVAGKFVFELHISSLGPRMTAQCQPQLLTTVHA